MVRVAIAGGSGQVAQEVVEALLASGKHEIIILSRNVRQITRKGPIPHTMHWQTVDYSDKAALTEAIRGVHTLLSFVQIISDPYQKSQKNLIDAAVSAGVKRFAPSEYGSAGTINMAWWQGKEVIREYLKEVNEKETVLEYTLFQPGLFLNYLAYPYKTSNYVDPLQTIFDFQNRRAIVIDGHEDAVMTLTTVADLAAIIVRAVEHDGRWPTTGGISGNRLTFSQIIEIGSRVRGHQFSVEKVETNDLLVGDLQTSWGLEAVHQAVPEEQASAMLKAVSIGILLSSKSGAWDSSDEMNQLFPDYEFAQAEDFLRGVWGGKE